MLFWVGYFICWTVYERRLNKFAYISHSKQLKMQDYTPPPSEDGNFTYSNWNPASFKFCKRTDKKTGDIDIDECPAWPRKNYWVRLHEQIKTAQND